MQYKIDLAKEREPDDEVLELSGVTIFLDQQSVPYLDGLTIDFRRPSPRAASSSTTPSRRRLRLRQILQRLIGNATPRRPPRRREIFLWPAIPLGL
jgi:hypothetical protein